MERKLQGCCGPPHPEPPAPVVTWLPTAAASPALRANPLGPWCRDRRGCEDLAAHVVRRLSPSRRAGDKCGVGCCRRFWQCPNGKDCKYRHALPPGYVLKSQMKELLEAERANAPSIEEEIEAERAKVDARTPITEDVSSVTLRLLQCRMDDCCL